MPVSAEFIYKLQIFLQNVVLIIRKILRLQNETYFAITGNTTAEIIYNKADAKKKNGSFVWKEFSKRQSLKSDTTIVKNYLEELEIKKLERTVSGYLDYIERLIETHTIFTMDTLA